MAVAGRGAGQPAHRGLGDGHARHGYLPPARYRRHCWYHTDEWPAYAAVLPPHAHRRDEAGQTNVAEALNCSLRQRCSVLVRKSCSFSKSLSMHHARIKIVINQHNAAITLP
ncbi:MAG: IS1 family transposase [Hymenobacter sp.]|nr:MAG: IS1 family transposase [Hymenobacter sp.]